MRADFPYASLWLPVPKRQTFTYRIPLNWDSPLQVGHLVWAPLGRRKVVGMVASLDSKAPPQLQTLKTLIEPLPEWCAVTPALFKLFDWAKNHYLTPPGEVLRTFIPTSLLKGKTNHGARARLQVPPSSFTKDQVVTLNSDQQSAVSEVQNKLGSFYPCLLQGITGSGKTEVYLRLCEEVLKWGGSTLVLVPEIALTPQMMGRFWARFGEVVGSYHSGMTEAQRFKTWRAVKEGRQKIVIGTRSAIGLPVKKLSLLIVDEEHDASYKQEERFRYHGRDLAVMRAKLEKIPVLLGSATPSLESLENVQNKKYHFHLLPERATRGKLPKISLIDLKKHSPHSETFLTKPIEEELRLILGRGEQALFFLNRRGFAPVILCQDCGNVFRCPNCEISLTYHKRRRVLRCHYCEYQIEFSQNGTSVHSETVLSQKVGFVSKREDSLTRSRLQRDHPLPGGEGMLACPECESSQITPIGTGTERLEEAFRKNFPGVRIGRLDRDVVSSRIKTEEVLSQFETGQLDILIGTQLVTKGHDFKRLTLVGILLADLTLNTPDFRASERVFQIVTQVAGRAGRHDLPGQVFLQTFRPEHYAITSALSQNPEQFFVHEKAFRQVAHYPPFSRMVLLRFSGIQLKRVEQAAKKFSTVLEILFQRHQGVKILGPAPSTLEKLRGKFRWQILLRTSRFEAMRRVLEKNIPHLENQLPAGVQLALDVDPVGVF